MAILDAASNYASCSLEVEAMPVEGYFVDHIIKELLAGLSHTVSFILTAMNCVEKHKVKQIRLALMREE